MNRIIEVEWFISFIFGVGATLIFLELMGGRQPVLGLQRNEHQTAPQCRIEQAARSPRKHEPNTEELAEHAAFIGSLNDPLWRR